MIASLACRSLKSSHNEAVKKPLLCEDKNEITSQTSNHLPDIDINHAWVFIFFNPSF